MHMLVLIIGLPRAEHVPSALHRMPRDVGCRQFGHEFGPSPCGFQLFLAARVEVFFLHTLYYADFRAIFVVFIFGGIVTGQLMECIGVMAYGRRHEDVT